MEAEIRKLAKKRAGDDSDDEDMKKKPKTSYLQAELAKYTTGKGRKKGKRKDEGDVLAALDSFRGKLQSTMLVDDEAATATEPAEDGEAAVPAGEEAGMEVDDDTGFMSHALHFPKDDGEEGIKAERDYEVIDPRQRSAKAKEEERERKRLAKSGGKYRR